MPESEMEHLEWVGFDPIRTSIDSVAMTGAVGGLN
jgi:hypothetical protein